MLHEHIPVRRDQEVCCGSCGMVLEDVFQTQNTVENGFYQGLDILMVGTSLEGTISWRFQRNTELIHKQQVLQRFIDITKEFGLTDRIAFETMRRLLKKRRGMYSYRLQIRELVDVLCSTNENILLYHKKVKAIQEKYSNISGWK